MMPVVPLASPLSGTTVSVHKLKKEKRGAARSSPASGSFWSRCWPLNTPANFPTLVHITTGRPTGGISTLQKAAVGSPNYPAKGFKGGGSRHLPKNMVPRGSIEKWLALYKEDRSLREHKFTYQRTTKHPSGFKLGLSKCIWTVGSWKGVSPCKNLQSLDLMQTLKVKCKCLVLSFMLNN